MELQRKPFVEMSGVRLSHPLELLVVDGRFVTLQARNSVVAVSQTWLSSKALKKWVKQRVA